MDSVFKLKQEINQLLEERPEYRDFQNRIENQLKNAGSFNNKVVILKMLMAENVIKLKEALSELYVLTEKSNHTNPPDSTEK